MAAVLLFWQLLPSVPVTVYVTLAVGVATTLVPLVALNPVEGLQLYTTAPPAVKVVLLPLHNADEPADTVTVGKGFTVIVTVFVFWHELPSVPVTV